MDLSALWEKLQAMLNWAVVLLPNLVLGALVPQRIHVMHVQSRVLQAIKQVLIEHGIDLPFPTQQILFHDQTEETDGDRSRQREGWPAGTRRSVPRPMRIGEALRGLKPDGHEERAP